MSDSPERAESLPPPSFFQTLFAPWHAVIRPLTGATTLLRCGRVKLAIAVLLHLIVFGAGIVLLGLWADSIRRGSMPDAANPPFQRLSIAEVWVDWHRVQFIGPAEFAFVFGCTILLLAAATLAAVTTPRVHTGGSVIGSFERAFRITFSAAGLMFGMVVVLGPLVVLAYHRTILGSGPRQIPIENFWALACLVGCGLVIMRVWRVAAALTDEPPAAADAPVCESCGYELSHHREDERCPECALPVAESLSPARRNGNAWERAADASPDDCLRAWVRTSLAVVFQPRRFYSSLPMRGGMERADAFAGLHYRWLTAGAVLWVALISTIIAVNNKSFFPALLPPLASVASVTLVWRRSPWLRPTTRGAGGLSPVLVSIVLWAVVLSVVDAYGSWAVTLPFLVMTLIALIITPILSWLGHRFFGLLFFAQGVHRRSLRHDRWAEKIIRYEVAYVWCFCLSTASLITSFVLFEDWIGRMLGDRMFLTMIGFPAEPACVLLAAAALGVFWLHRYSIAVRCTRWSNR